MNHQEALTEYLAAFVSGLVQAGVKDVVISPGSRSTPLALLIAENRDLNVYMNIDERSAGFFALGMAKASQRPVALLCTSGTAAANYFPAVVEANLSRVPLIILTADRPHELRDVGAPQAIDQIHLYGNHVRWFTDLALPEIGQEQYAFNTAVRAIKEATGHLQGPVHLNFPLREPLLPILEPYPFTEKIKELKISQGNLTISNETAREIAEQIQQIENGLIIVGDIDKPELAEAIHQFAQLTGYPIVADPLSQLRGSTTADSQVIDSYDAILKNEQAVNLLRPDLIIRFGSMPVSKPLTLFLKKWRQSPHIIVDGGSGWRDPQNLGTMMVQCDEAIFCHTIKAFFTEARQTQYFSIWKDLNHIAKETIASYLKSMNDLDEGKVIYELAKVIPENSTIFAGNSMPIRDVDTFFHQTRKNIHLMANRGANGIDGVVSTAIGAAVYRNPLYLVIGDLSFFHDLNGLLAAKLNDISINIILINNDGGGIFSFLPQSKLDRHYELLFGTPIGIDFSYAMKMYGGEYCKITNWGEFDQAIEATAEKSGIHVIEVQTNRQANLESHRNMWRLIGEEIDRYFEAMKNGH